MEEVWECLMTREEKEMALSVGGLRQKRGGALPRM
jgi:hypothetical protein